MSIFLKIMLTLLSITIAWLFGCYVWYKDEPKTNIPDWVGVPLGLAIILNVLGWTIYFICIVWSA